MRPQLEFLGRVDVVKGNSLEPTLIRVLVVEDYELFRRFLRSTLGKRPGLRLVGEASDGDQKR